MNIPSTNSVPGSSPSSDPFHSARKEDLAKSLSGSVRNAGASKGVEGGDNAASGVHSNNKRLRAYVKEVANRLQNALSSTELAPRDRENLQALTGQFRDLIKRLENAYLSPTNSKNMHEELDRLLVSANQSLGNSKSANAEPTSGLDTVA